MPTVIITRPLADVLPKPRLICAWCPTFDRMAPSNKGQSHGICPACQEKLEAEMQSKAAA